MAAIIAAKEHIPITDFFNTHACSRQSSTGSSFLASFRMADAPTKRSDEELSRLSPIELSDAGHGNFVKTGPT